MNEDKWRRAEVIFAGAITIFTAVLTCVSIAQWRTANKALNVSERAFVFVSRIELQPATVPYDIIKTANASVVIQLTNSGNTPARHLFITGNCVMNPPEHFDFPDYAGVVHSASFLGPKQENGAMLPLQYLAALAVREGHAALKVYGHIEYIDDVSNKPHRTWFCYDYIVHKTAPSLVAGIDVFGACNEHNCEDDDCLESWDFMPRVAPMTTTAFDVDIPSPPTTPTATSTPPSVPKNRVRATQTSGTR